MYWWVIDVYFFGNEFTSVMFELLSTMWILACIGQIEIFIQFICVYIISWFNKWIVMYHRGAVVTLGIRMTVVAPTITGSNSRGNGVGWKGIDCVEFMLHKNLRLSIKVDLRFNQYNWHKKHLKGDGNFLKIILVNYNRIKQNPQTVTSMQLNSRRPTDSETNSLTLCIFFCRICKNFGPSLSEIIRKPKNCWENVQEPNKKKITEFVRKTHKMCTWSKVSLRLLMDRDQQS